MTAFLSLNAGRGRDSRDLEFYRGNSAMTSEQAKARSPVRVEQKSGKGSGYESAALCSLS